MHRCRSIQRWRSLLFIPAHEERFVAKAHLRGADAIILDLEDSVPPAGKLSARSTLKSLAARLREQGQTVVVRVNRDLEDCVEDLKAAVTHGVDAIMLPKTMGPEHVALVDELLTKLERQSTLEQGSVGIVALIETPWALGLASQIASASARVVALAIGPEDFSADCGFEPSYQNLFAPCQQLILSARSQGVRVYGLPGSIANFADVEAFSESTARAKAMGFDGVLCVHPSQVVSINAVYRPTDVELAHARRVVQAFDSGIVQGHGAIALDGAMIDLPVVMRARALLADSQRNCA